MLANNSTETVEVFCIFFANNDHCIELGLHVRRTSAKTNFPFFKNGLIKQ